MWGLKPILARIIGSIRHAWYGRVGEPVMWRGMCAEVTDSLTGGSVRICPLGEPIRIRAIIIREDRMTEQLEELILWAQRPDEPELLTEADIGRNGHAEIRDV
jgi:succinate dehydrogenase/fumarate reductase-like Fe-S protein